MHTISTIVLMFLNVIKKKNFFIFAPRFTLPGWKTKKIYIYIHASKIKVFVNMILCIFIIDV